MMDKAKRKPAPSGDEIRDDIGESLERRGIHDRELLAELLQTFGVHLGREKYRIEKDLVEKQTKGDKP